MKTYFTIFSLSVLTICASVVMTGCCTDRRENETDAHYFVRHSMSYVKDERTGLCFAVYNPGHETGWASAVPCTPEVEKTLLP